MWSVYRNRSYCADIALLERKCVNIHMKRITGNFDKILMFLFQNNKGQYVSFSITYSVINVYIAVYYTVMVIIL